jgi:hypothetical protein
VFCSIALVVYMEGGRKGRQKGRCKIQMRPRRYDLYYSGRERERERERGGEWGKILRMKEEEERAIQLMHSRLPCCQRVTPPMLE